MNVVNSLPPMRGSSVPPTRDLSVEPLSLLNVLHSEPTSITLSEEDSGLQHRYSILHNQLRRIENLCLQLAQ